MKGCIGGRARPFDKNTIMICISAGAVAGLSSVLRGISWLYIAALMGTGIFGALLVYKYHWAGIFNILLLSAVKFEPAPGDLLFVLLFIFGVVGDHLDFRRLRYSGVITWLLLVYAILSTLQLFFTRDMMVGMRYHIITIYLIAFCFYIFLYVSRDNIRCILIVYIISGTLSASLGLLGYAGLFPSLFMYDRYRIMGLFKDPNVLGPFLVPSVIIMLDDIWGKRLFRCPIWIPISLISINLLGIIATFSRGAWVNILVCLLVYTALKIKKIKFKDLNLKRIAIYVVLLAMIISMVWGLIISDEYKQFLYARVNFQSYDKDRFAVQRKGVSLAFINILGFGPGQFEYNVLRQTGVIFSAHNLYIRVALENGIIGFIFFFGILVLIIYKLIGDDKRGRSYNVTTPASLIAILSGILINSLVIDTLHWRHFWFFIGLSMASCVLGVGEKIGNKDRYKLERGNTSQRDMEWYSRRY